MKENKKYILAFSFLVLLPLVLSYMNYYYSSVDRFSWGLDHANLISFISFILAFFGCVVSIVLNALSPKKRIILYVIPIIFAVILLVSLYIGYSITRIEIG